MSMLLKTFSLIPCLFLTDNLFYQSAASPPLAAPAQTWKSVTANTRALLFLANAVAAANAQIHLG